MLGDLHRQAQKLTEPEGPFLTLKNKTIGISKPGLLVKSVTDGFDYAGVGDIPIGVVVDTVRKDAECRIQTGGTAKVWIDTNIAVDQPVRSITATDRAVRGACVPIGSKDEYTMVGRTLESGKGLVKILLSITPIINASGGGGMPAGGTIGQVLAKDSSVDYDTSWVSLDSIYYTQSYIDSNFYTQTYINANLVSSVDAGYGIDISGTATSPIVDFYGAGLDIDDGTVFGTFPSNQNSTYILFSSGIVSEKILASITPLSSFDNDLGWTSSGGTVTSVSGGVGIDVTNPSTNPIVTLDVSELSERSGSLVAGDRLVGATAAGVNFAETISNIPLSIFDNTVSNFGQGTVESVTGGYGIVSSGGANPDIDFDGTELDIDTNPWPAFTGTSYFIFTAGLVTERIRTTEVPVSTFVNDAGYITSGGVTSVSGGEGITVTNPSTNAIVTLAFSELTATPVTLVGADYLVGMKADGTQFRELISDIRLSQFDSTNYWTWAAPYLYYNGGNVGIGTSSPDGILDVVGGNVFFTDTHTFAFQPGNGNITISSGDSDSIAVSVNYRGYALGTTRFRDFSVYNGKGTILLHADGSAGNVGIGTTSPDALFNVESEAPQMLYTETSGTTNQKNFRIMLNGGKAYFSSRNDTNTGAGDGGDMMTFDMSNGYAGIGTTVPEVRADISCLSADLTLPASSGSTAAGIMRVGYYDHNWAGSELNFGVNNGGTYPSWIQAQNPADHSVQRNLSLQPRGGNVGIGTSEPLAKTHIKQSASEIPLIIDSSATANASYTQYKAGGSAGFEIGMEGSGASYAYSTYFGTFGSGTPLMTILTSGNVGIGTTTPSYKLDVVGVGKIGYNNNQSSTQSLILTGHGCVSSGSPYGNYGTLHLSATASYTSGARQYWITNSYGANKFAIIRSTTATTSPVYGNGGALTSGYADFIIDNTGNVDIPNGDLTVNGFVEAYDTSDMRYKDVIGDLDKNDTANAVLGLRTFRYTQKGEERVRIGVSAQEVQKVFPENVKKDKTGKLGVHYGKMIPALIATIQRQQEQIDELIKLIK